MSVRMWTLWLASGFWLTACGGTSAPDYASRQGSIMGTYFSMTARCGNHSAPVFDSAVSALEGVDARMSTYRPDSLLMQLNRHPPGEDMVVSADLWAVLQLADEVRRETGGAFDAAIGALVNAWGFGPVPAGSVPTAEEIHALLPPAGGGYRLLPPDRVARTAATVFIDLSAIAKGFAVDVALQALLAGGCTDAMVDVGGEVRVVGTNPSGASWRIGIETPVALHGGVQAVLALRDQAVATSGDYRNYREVDGERVSHTIDPRDGHPIRHGLASVTVVHATTAAADAWATALNVLGPDAGFELATRKNLPVYLLVRSGDGFQARYTEAMKPLMSLP